MLTYRVVPSRLDAAALRRDIQAGGGRARLTTASGGTLVAMMSGPRNIVVEDGQGGVANVEVYDVYQSNGVIHSIDHVLLPATPTG